MGNGLVGGWLVIAACWMWRAKRWAMLLAIQRLKRKTTRRDRPGGSWRRPHHGGCPGASVGEPEDEVDRPQANAASPQDRASGSARGRGLGLEPAIARPTVGGSSVGLETFSPRKPTRLPAEASRTACSRSRPSRRPGAWPRRLSTAPATRSCPQRRGRACRAARRRPGSRRPRPGH